MLWEKNSSDEIILFFPKLIYLLKLSFNFFVTQSDLHTVKTDKSNVNLH